MRRLRDQTILNNSEDFYKTFLERRKNPVQWMDLKRWEALVSKFKGGILGDLGCLDSMVPFLAKQKYPISEVWGLDQANEVIKTLAEEYPEINYIHGDVYNTTFPKNYFDYLVAGELIEHLEKPEDFFKEAFRILKPKGILALTTPKEETEAGEIDGHRHLFSFSQNDIRKLCEPYSSKIKVGTLKGTLLPYKYHFPYIIAWVTKK